MTGASSGVGLEHAKLLYGRNATVYIGARSISRCNEGIVAVQKAYPGSSGAVLPMVLDLADLRTIKPAVEGFLEREKRLDVLQHNAGVMRPPEGSKTVLVSKDGRTVIRKMC